MSFYSSSDKNDLLKIFPKKEDLSENQNYKKLWNKLITNEFNSQSEIFSSEDEIISDNFYKNIPKNNLVTSFEKNPIIKSINNKKEEVLNKKKENILINEDFIKKPESPKNPSNLQNSLHSMKSQKSYSHSFKTYQKNQIKPIICKCKKTNCLKLYCDCFASQNMCSKSCKCLNCYNIKNYSNLKKNVIKELLQQNPLAFESKYKEINKNKVKIHLRGCACKNSKCVKNYCECFLVNVKCTDLCRCKDCCNLNGFLGDIVKDFKIVVKRKRKKKEFFFNKKKNTLKEYYVNEDENIDGKKK